MKVKHLVQFSELIGSIMHEIKEHMSAYKVVHCWSLEYMSLSIIQRQWEELLHSKREARALQWPQFVLKHRNMSVKQCYIYALVKYRSDICMGIHDVFIKQFC